ncbi:MAG: hypothetical protein ABW352_10890, partial [Polyangiales bacterium]
LLMLERDAQLTSAVRRGLSAHGIELTAVHGEAEALQRIACEPFDAALLESDLLGEEGLLSFAGLPLIFTTTCLEPAGTHRFFGRGLLLNKPFTSTQLLAALQQARTPSSHRCDGLVDVLRRANSAGASMTLRVGDALLVIERGEIAHAECGRRRGEPALAEALSLRQPFTRLPTRPYVRTIERPFQLLMLEILEQLDDRGQP